MARRLVRPPNVGQKLAYRVGHLQQTRDQVLKLSTEGPTTIQNEAEVLQLHLDPDTDASNHHMGIDRALGHSLGPVALDMLTHGLGYTKRHVEA